MSAEPTPGETPDEATPDEGERQERLRHNSSSDPENKTVEELNPMEADSWSGGSVNPDATKVARGEAPANRGQSSDQPAENSRPATPSEYTRPWAPEADDKPGG